MVVEAGFQIDVLYPLGPEPLYRPSEESASEAFTPGSFRHQHVAYHPERIGSVLFDVDQRELFATYSHQLKVSSFQRREQEQSSVF